MSMKVNDDGKFFGRVVAAFAGAAPVLAVGAIIWWRDAGLAAEAIGRIEKRLDRVENDGQEMRRSAAEDRQKTAELAGDVRNVLRSTARIEALLDRWTAAPSPSRP